MTVIKKRYDFLVVGAGLAGATLAERLATVGKKEVLIVDQRTHVGGNTYDYYNDDGILVQKYGPHIFHTNDTTVWNYLSEFTEWNHYVHRVLARVNDREVYLPINLTTLEGIYGRPFTESDMERYLAERRVRMTEVLSARDVVVSQVGEELYELLFRNYTKKQWGVYPEELSPEVTRRLPVRTNRDTRYFTDVYQGIPVEGYTRMFEKMLADDNINVLLNTDYETIRRNIKYDKLVYTGPVDLFFAYKYGRLPYRSLQFVHETLPVDRYQNAAVVNYPNERDYTRITEFKQFYLQNHSHTTICYEYPMDNGDPFYPIPRRECLAIYARYKQEAEQLENTYFTGRLARYKYMNMDQVVADSLALFEKIRHEN